MAQAIAEKIQRGIAWVVSWTVSIRSAVNNSFLAPGIEQRPHDRDLRVEHPNDRPISHPLQPGESSPANKMHQYSFHLVICSMTDGYGLGVQTMRLPHQKTVTHDTRRF